MYSKFANGGRERDDLLIQQLWDKELNLVQKRVVETRTFQLRFTELIFLGCREEFDSEDRSDAYHREMHTVKMEVFRI